MNDIDPYKVRIGGVIADPYRIAISFGLDSAIGEAAKKLLRCGRKHKDLKTDVQEAIKTLTRWLEIQDDIEREASIDSLRYVPSVPNAANANPTQEQIVRNVALGLSGGGLSQKQADDYARHLAAHNAALGAKTKMEEILDSRETTWP
jgi:hypothetical protein